MNARVAIESRRAPAWAVGPRMSAGGLVASALAWIAERGRLRRDREYLHAMPDYLLNDIGINRLDIDHALVHGRRGVGE